MPVSTKDLKGSKGSLRYLCSAKTSKKITGHGVGGDDSVVWDKRFPDQVKEAQEVFDKLLAKGYSALTVDGRKVRSFDPEAEEIIMVFPVVGG